MSLHVSPFYAGFSPCIPGGEGIAPELIDGIGPKARPDPDMQGPAKDRLSVRLDAIGMVLSVSASGQIATVPALHVALAVETSPASEAEGRIHFHFGQGDFPQGLQARHASRGTKGDDAVMERCSRALAQLSVHEGEFADIYADALRLAIVTRMLGLRSQPMPAIEQAPPAAPSGRSGLPKWRLKRVAAYVDENIGEAITLAGMAAAAGLSRMHFAAQFRAATGIRPHEYVMRRRIERAQQMLLETRVSLVQVALSVGFQTQAHFTTVFRRFVGDTPYQWRCANREPVQMARAA
jgi:AraC family transcriptional regulator